MADTRLCAVDDIPDGGSAGFTVEHQGRRTAYMAIRQGGRVYVYENSCPHIGSPLDFTPGKFLNREGTHILCSTHGALFRIEDGYCVSGPCADDELDAQEIDIRQNDVYLVG